MGSGPRYLICTPTGAPAIWMKAVVSADVPAKAPAISKRGAGRPGGKAGHEHAVGRNVEAQPHLVELPRRVELVGAGEHGTQGVGAQHLAVAQHRKTAAVARLAVVRRSEP